MNVIVFRPSECAAGDVTVLMESRTGQDREEVDREIGPRLEELAEGLSFVSQAYLDRRLDQLAREARRLGRVASEVGLNRVARVASTVCVLAQRNDPAALAANVARLIRLGEAALSEIWHIQDQHY